MPESRMDWKELRRSRRALGRFVLIGLGLALVATVLPSSTLADRIKVAALGGAIVALGVLRPSGFWDNPQIDGWKWAFGERGVRIIYAVLGLLWIVAALAGKI